MILFNQLLKKKVGENALKEKTVVITGTMSVSRGDIKNAWKNLVQKLVHLFLKKTDYIIYGEEAGSKYDKAIELWLLFNRKMNNMIS